MSKKIENPAGCEVRAVIRILNAQSVRQLITVYGESVMNEANVRKCRRMFNEGRTYVSDEERSGRPSLNTEYLKNRTVQHIRTNRRFILDDIHAKFLQISRSLIHEIVTEHLR
jgi:hypothetical protein